MPAGKMRLLPESPPLSIRENLIVEYNSNSNETHHEQMAQNYVQALAGALEQFDNHRQSTSFYTQMAWGGLQQTKEWFALPSKGIDTTAIHNTIAHEEFGDSKAKGIKCLD